MKLVIILYHLLTRFYNPLEGKVNWPSGGTAWEKRWEKGFSIVNWKSYLVALIEKVKGMGSPSSRHSPLPV